MKNPDPAPNRAGIFIVNETGGSIRHFDKTEPTPIAVSGSGFPSRPHL